MDTKKALSGLRVRRSGEEWSLQSPSIPAIPSAYSILNFLCLANLPSCTKLSSIRKPPLIASFSRQGWLWLSHRPCAPAILALSALSHIRPCLLPWVMP